MSIYQDQQTARTPIDLVEKSIGHEYTKVEGVNCRNFVSFQGLGATFRVLIKHTSLFNKGLKPLRRHILGSF